MQHTEKDEYSDMTNDMHLYCHLLHIYAYFSSLLILHNPR